MTVHVLVGTSPSDAARAEELRARAERLGAEPAFLQLEAPSLGAVLRRLADERVGRVVLVGVGDVSGPGVSWLRRLAAHWWATYGDGAPEVLTAPAYLDDDAGWDTLVGLARPVTDGGPGVTSDAWEDVPSHRQQVLVCRGPRCTAAGAEDSWKALVLALMSHGLGDHDVLVTPTGCQLPCNHAPVVTVHPQDVWYGGVDPAAAERIVAEHLVAGAPVAEHRLRRAPGSRRAP